KLCGSSLREWSERYWPPTFSCSLAVPLRDPLWLANQSRAGSHQARHLGRFAVGQCEVVDGEVFLEPPETGGLRNCNDTRLLDQPAQADLGGSSLVLAGDSLDRRLADHPPER